MFKEDGGVGTIPSSRLPTWRAGLPRVDPAGRRFAFRPATFDSEPRPAAADLGRVLFRVADCARAAGRFAVLFFFGALFARRPAARVDLRLRAVLDVFREAAGLVVPPALRLAMVVSFRNLDSLAISVVLSSAYRKSAVPPQGACRPKLRAAGSRHHSAGTPSIESWTRPGRPSDE
jgi:hypothetical protein